MTKRLYFLLLFCTTIIVNTLTFAKGISIRPITEEDKNQFYNKIVVDPRSEIVQFLKFYVENSDEDKPLEILHSNFMKQISLQFSGKFKIVETEFQHKFLENSTFTATIKKVEFKDLNNLDKWSAWYEQFLSVLTSEKMLGEMSEIQENFILFNLLTTAINGKSFPPSWTESRKYTKTPSMSVGITYKRLDDKLKVMSVLLNSPAFLSGMQQEDIIVKINNRDIKELSNEQIDALFLGTTDGFVKLKVKKWGMANFHTKILRRTSLKTSPVDVVIDQKTLFLIIHNFDNRTPEWIASIFKNELTEDIENIVIDLRGTIGNEISMLKSMNLLLPKMNAGYIQYKTVKKKFSLSGESLVGQRKVIGVVDNNTEGIAKWAGRLIQSKGFLVGTTVDTSGQIFKSLELTDGTTVTIPIGEIFDFNNNSLKNNHIFPIICLRTIEGYTDLNVMLQNIKNNTFVFPDSKLESDKLKNACGNLALNDERTHFYRNVIIQLFKPEVFNEIKSQQKNILNF